MAEEHVRVLYYLFFPGGGIGQYSHHLLPRLAARPDLDVELACPPDYHWRATQAYRSWPRLFRISHRLAPLRKARFLIGQLLSPMRALRRARETGAEILHLAQLNYLSFPCWRRALSRWGGQLVCTAHDVRRARYIVSRRWGERQLRALYQRCDAVFVHSRAQARELAGFAGVSPERIHVVPHGPVELAPRPVESRAGLRARHRLPQDARIALYFGYLRPQKNLDILLRALARAGDEHLHLRVAGNQVPGAGAHLEECRGLVQYLGLDHRVTFDVRFIPDQEVAELLAASDFMVLPYGPDFTSQSGVLNLAAHYELPVLATPTASLRESLEEHPIGLLTGSFDEAALAAGLGEMLRLLEKGTRWDFGAYREAHSWQRNAELTREVFLKLVRDGVAA